MTARGTVPPGRGRHRVEYHKAMRGTRVHSMAHLIRVAAGHPRGAAELLALSRGFLRPQIPQVADRLELAAGQRDAGSLVHGHPMDGRVSVLLARPRPTGTGVPLLVGVARPQHDRLAVVETGNAQAAIAADGDHLGAVAPVAPQGNVEDGRVAVGALHRLVHRDGAHLLWEVGAEAGRVVGGWG